jgi:hypothetical protein
MAASILPVTPGEVPYPAAEHPANLVACCRALVTFDGGQAAAAVGALQPRYYFGD